MVHIIYKEKGLPVGQDIWQREDSVLAVLIPVFLGPLAINIAASSLPYSIAKFLGPSGDPFPNCVLDWAGMWGWPTARPGAPGPALAPEC